MSDSERRTVRPYLGVSRCQDAFDRISLQVGGESYDSGATAIERHRVTYDIAKTQKKMKAADLPDHLIERLDHGI